LAEDPDRIGNHSLNCGAVADVNPASVGLLALRRNRRRNGSGAFIIQISDDDGCPFARHHLASSFANS
jgi:hypothetical protein